MASDNDKTTTATAETAVPPDPKEGPGKGRAFFERARTVAATGNYDYGIEMYLQGLNLEPFNVEEHKALRDTAFRRKVSGAKSGGGLLGALGGGPKSPFKGKSAKETMLNNEFTLARDVGNIPAMQAILRNADVLGLKEVVLWIGQILKEANKTNKSPKADIFIELAEILAKNEHYALACAVIADAVTLKPNDLELANLANVYAAQDTMKKGKYDQGESFKASIKDVEETKKLLEEENLGKSEDYRKKVLAQAKTDYEANPKELQVIAKYTKALIDMEQEEDENEAIRVLTKGFQETKIYRLKATIGDVRMKQFRRNLQILKDTLAASPNDKEIQHQLEQLNKERLAFEIEEFRDRTENVPTDMIVKYEYGRRLWEAKKFDEAIPAFQEAQQNAKVRVDAMFFLGRCFLNQGMYPEAAETLKHAIEGYDLAVTGNKKSIEMHYWFARALEENKQFPEADAVYSKVIRWDISYRDARKRLNDLRNRGNA